VSLSHHTGSVHAEGYLPSRPDCPICGASRLHGKLSKGSRVAARATAALVATVAIGGTFTAPVTGIAPAAAQGTQPEEDDSDSPEPPAFDENQPLEDDDAQPPPSPPASPAPAPPADPPTARPTPGEPRAPSARDESDAPSHRRDRSPRRAPAPRAAPAPASPAAPAPPALVEQPAADRPPLAGSGSSVRGGRVGTSCDPANRCGPSRAASWGPLPALRRSPIWSTSYGSPRVDRKRRSGSHPRGPDTGAACRP